MTNSTPAVETKPESAFARLNTFLDLHVLPYPVKYLTNRVVILATLVMLAPLIIFKDNPVFVLLINSYLNVMSVVVSSTVLLYSTISAVRDKVAADRREAIAKAHEEMVDQRAQADHDYLEQIRKEIVDHVNTSLDNIQKELLVQLNQIHTEDHNHIEETHRAVMAEVSSHREELGDLRQLIEALHKSAGLPPISTSN